MNRVLYVRNLPYKITGEEMYDIFGKFGALRQIRLGATPETRGTAFVVYEDIFDAKNACDHLSGFNVCNRCVDCRLILIKRRNFIHLFDTLTYFDILFLPALVLLKELLFWKTLAKSFK